MKIIAAITNNNALGKNGDMLFHISEDLKRFKALTMGYPIIMGRKTFESFPKGPLPGRRNLVITHNEEYDRPGIEVYPSVADALVECPNIEPFVIGGGEIYRLTMPFASELYITHIDVDVADADTFFPHIDPSVWAKTYQSDLLTDPRTSVQYRFVNYQRIPTAPSCQLL